MFQSGSLSQGFTGQFTRSCRVRQGCGQSSRKLHLVTRAREREEKLEVECEKIENDVQDWFDSIFPGELEIMKRKMGDTSFIQGEDLDLSKRIQKLVSTLEKGLVERETEVRLLILAAFCGEHLLLLGPPGTAKSELGRRLASITQGAFFERLLTRFSVPEELFGPLSMKGLEADEYVRQTKGYLPDASVAFIDEIFKANSAILNSLLTILNERLFDNGNERLEVPLLCLVGASNELPESEELDALYDRFLFRKGVTQVSQNNLTGLLKMAASQGLPSASKQTSDGTNGAGIQLCDDEDDEEECILASIEEMQRIRSVALATVEVPDDVLEVLSDIRDYLQNKCEPPVYVSDRRLFKIVSMLRVAAYTCGRQSVSLYDTLLLQYTLCSKPDEADVIKDWLLTRIVPDSDGQAKYLLKGLFRRCCNVNTENADWTTTGKAISNEIKALKEVLLQQLATLETSSVAATSMNNGHMWISNADATRVQQTMDPLLRKAREDLRVLLKDTRTLEVTVDLGIEKGVMEPYLMAITLPRYWKDYVRNGPIEDEKSSKTWRDYI